LSLGQGSRFAPEIPNEALPETLAASFYRHNDARLFRHHCGAVIPAPTDLVRANGQWCPSRA